MKKAQLQEFTNDLRKIYIEWIECGKCGDELLIEFLEQGDFIFRGLLIPEMWRTYFGDIQPPKLYTIIEEVVEIVGIKEARYFATVADAQILESIVESLQAYETNQRRVQWDVNHIDILQAISSGTRNRMPTKTQIAIKTGLSRQTVHKHFQEMQLNGYKAEQKEVQQAGLEAVVAMLFQQSVIHRDVRAAKLYFDIVSQDERLAASSKQANYIQVNNTRIDINLLEQLAPDKLTLIESILTDKKPIDISSFAKPQLYIEK